MLAINFIQFMACLLLAGFTIRTVQRSWPDSTVSKALASVY